MQDVFSPPRPVGRAGQTTLLLAVVGAVGLTLGVLTAYAQAWLPDELGSLANSAGSWALVAFLLALLAKDTRAAALFGCLALLALLVGYVLGANARGFSSGTALMTFWGAAAVVAGPMLGLGAHWVKSTRGPLAALGVGAMSGVLVGEGAYGLSRIADTTYTPYWWAEAAVGTILLAWVATRRLEGPAATALAIVATAVTAAAFVVVYGLNLIAVLP